jgi:Fic family protein
MAGLEARGSLSSTLLREARKVVEKAAAIDTGAIEGLYDTNRGFTFTIAVESTLWQAMVEEQKGPRVLAFIESQLRAYEYVLDFATQQVPIVEAWIRTLHAEICRNQETYPAYTEIGVQELPLPLGEYKHLPNHVIGRDGNVHSHAPVDLTPAEMNRLCVELRGSDFMAAHPILQASYAHYAFVLIHPFADGNGRVARALASVFTYRSNSIPLLILAENKKEYFDTLGAADKGDYQSFVDFTLERGLDAIRLFDESVRVATTPRVEDAVKEIKSLFSSYVEVNEAGKKLIDSFGQAIRTELDKHKIKGIFDELDKLGSGHYSARIPGYRTPESGTAALRLNLSTNVPAPASVSHTFSLEVPRDCGKDDDLVLRNVRTEEVFEARVSELVPSISAAFQMRLSMAAERVVSDALRELSKSATYKRQS